MIETALPASYALSRVSSQPYSGLFVCFVFYCCYWFYSITGADTAERVYTKSFPD